MQTGFGRAHIIWLGIRWNALLKQKIASSFRENEIPELKRVQRIYSHDLSSLLSLSGLKDEFEAEMEKSAELRTGRLPRNGPNRPATRFGQRNAQRLYWRQSAVKRDCYDGC
jgi:hypothetical protein